MSNKKLLLFIIILYVLPLFIYSFFLNDPSEDLFLAYVCAMLAILIGYVAATKNIILVKRASPLRARTILKVMKFIIFFQLLSLLMALPFIINNFEDYRNLFFIEQKKIFGFENFGIIFNTFSEYLFVVMAAILLTDNCIKRSVLIKYILAWALLGSLITFGRWYILYAFILIVTTYPSSKKQKIGILAFASSLVLLSFTMIYSCRSFQCDITNLLSLDNQVGGIFNYFILPIGLFDFYKDLNGYDLKLNLGFMLYPILQILKIFNLNNYTDFQYNNFSLAIQENITIENIGTYNAFVGQITASYVGFKYLGIFFNFLPFGYMLNMRYKDSINKLNSVNIIAFMILVFGFFIPSISGPMAFFEIFFMLLFSNFSLSKKLIQL